MLSRFTTIMLIALLPLFLTGCYTLLIGGAAGAGGYYVAKDERPAKRIVNDAAITSSINTKYAMDEQVGFWDVNVSTRNGVVTLSGVAMNPQAKARAVEIAQLTDGVMEVVDQIQVRSR